MIARMLQFLYHGSYDILNIATGLTRLLDKSSPTVVEDDIIPAQDFDFETHAAMYAIADRFEIPALKAVSETHFVSELRSKHFSVADLVSAIDLVYTTTPESDHGLRKWVVYRAQQIESELVRHDDFKAVLKGQPDFAWDFATRYAKANYLWCAYCKDTIDLVECRCGFAGMCGDPICKEGAAARLRCTRCEYWGILRREVPRLEGNVKLGELGRTDVPDAPIRKAGGKKKRRVV
jgi:hypothetical protein